MEEGYYELDLDGNLTFCSDSYRQRSGYSSKEIMEMNSADLTAEEDRERMLQTFVDIYRTGKPIGGFMKTDHEKDGQTPKMAGIR